MEGHIKISLFTHIVVFSSQNLHFIFLKKLKEVLLVSILLILQLQLQQDYILSRFMQRYTCLQVCSSNLQLALLQSDQDACVCVCWWEAAQAGAPSAHWVQYHYAVQQNSLSRQPEPLGNLRIQLTQQHQSAYSLKLL